MMPSIPCRPGRGAFVRCLGGKLIGLRTGDLRSLAEWRELSATFFRAVTDFAGRPVVCGDLRGLTVLDDDAYAHLVESMRLFNPKLQRSALLVSPTSMVGLRLESALRDANNSARHVCTDPAVAKAWLSSCLDTSERTHLDEFLAGGQARRRSIRSMPANGRKRT